ncbi:MAG: hypothetical protein K940chlam2_01765 [Chlamydiae bacterium]|nr:hypothetical protein [Chlamydiota bacterium]
MKNFVVTALLLVTPLLGDTDFGIPPSTIAPSTVPPPTYAPTTSESNAEAISWLTLQDQGQYGSAWSDASSLMKDIITQSQWVAAMKALRQPLGSVKTRKTGTPQTVKSLPGGTKGDFVIISYQTSFSFKSLATEKVTLMTDALNQWRVVAYDVSSS